MKKSITLILVSFITILAQAQKINPESYTRELSGGVGFSTPFSNSYGAYAAYWINYSHYLGRHTGIRLGAQFMPENLEIDNFVSFPVAVSWRTGMRTTSDAYAYGGVLALNLLDAFVWDDDNFFADLLAAFVLSLVNRAEVFAGLTPGYIFGESNLLRYYYQTVDGVHLYETSGIRKSGSLYMSADAGINLSWRIWRFTINMTPAVHYNVTGNYHSYYANEEIVHQQDTPLRWLFSMNFGLGYLF